jgi:uncharacterized membrane-anchored protein YjiN (DUF445 family)
MIMDTKQLYDVLVDNKIDLDMDSVADAEQVWIQAIFESEEDFADTCADYMAEMSDKDFAEIGRKLAAGYKDITAIVDTHIGKSEMLTAAWASSMAQNFTRAASIMARNHADQITKLVKDNADQWMADCIGYSVDMEEGQREDAAMFRADR